MLPKYSLIYKKDGKEVKMEFKTLTEIATLLELEIHIIRKINNLTEGRLLNNKPQHRHKDIFETYKIYDIKKPLKQL